MLMSVSELRKAKKPDPDYVVPDSFHSLKPSASTLPNANTALTKEVGGKLYAIANPNTRDEAKDYQTYIM